MSARNLKQRIEKLQERLQGSRQKLIVKTIDRSGRVLEILSETPGKEPSLVVNIMRFGKAIS